MIGLYAGMQQAAGGAAAAAAAGARRGGAEPGLTLAEGSAPWPAGTSSRRTILTCRSGTHPLSTPLGWSAHMQVGGQGGASGTGRWVQRQAGRQRAGLAPVHRRHTPCSRFLTMSHCPKRGWRAGWSCRLSAGGRGWAGAWQVLCRQPAAARAAGGGGRRAPSQAARLPAPRHGRPQAPQGLQLGPAPGRAVEPEPWPQP
jgi:hypothetical protein